MGSDIYSSTTPVEFLQNVLKEFPSDYDFLIWDAEEVAAYNDRSEKPLRQFDWNAVEVKPINHFPIEFAKRLLAQGNFSIGVTEAGQFQVISFAGFRKHLVSCFGNVFLVALNF